MKSGPGAQDLLTFSLLLVAARCVDAFTLNMIVHCPPESLNWTEARRYCRENYRDLVTLDLVNSVDVAQALTSAGVGQAWIGLHRDPEDDRVWKWINLTSGEGISGEDLSTSPEWETDRQSAHCAIISNNMWYSVKCLSEYYYFCKRPQTHSWAKWTWYESRRRCVNLLFSSLVTLTSSSNTYDQSGWIGLYQTSIGSWKWISDDPSEYRHWAPGEPITKDCGTFDLDNSKWHSHACSEDRRFACYDDNVVVVTENKTWEDALSHCRGMQSQCENRLNTCRYRYELLSLEQPTDYSYVRKLLFEAETDEV